MGVDYTFRLGIGFEASHAEIVKVYASHAGGEQSDDYAEEMYEAVAKKVGATYHMVFSGDGTGPNPQVLFNLSSEELAYLRHPTSKREMGSGRVTMKGAISADRLVEHKGHLDLLGQRMVAYGFQPSEPVIRVCGSVW